MTKRSEVFAGVVLEERALTVEELACACSVAPNWVIERVEAGLIGHVGETEWRFASGELARARRMRAIERAFEANQELAAFVADLLEEVERLRQQLLGR